MNQQRMKNELTINGETLDASLEGILAIVRFLNNNYQFRFNQLNGKVEFVNQKSAPTEWRDLTEPAINSIILKARMEQVSKNSPKVFKSFISSLGPKPNEAVAMLGSTK